MKRDGAQQQDHDSEKGRAVCYDCFKPQQDCICKSIVQVDNRTEILILQHKCERTHPFGTVRIATLGLKRVQLKVAWPNEDQKFTGKFDCLEGAGLLFPSENARPLTSLLPNEKPQRLVVLDGSWADARNLYRDNPWLADLPHYRLVPKAPSRYRIRAEPNETAMSTIEAIAQSLGILEPQTPGIEQLLHTFDAMIDRQIDHMKSLRGSGWSMRRRLPRQKESRTIPRAMKNNIENVVIAFGESVPDKDNGRALVSWVAQRIGDKELFEQYIALPKGAALTENHKELMGLSHISADDGISATQLREKWSRFARPEDVVVTWNSSTLDLFTKLVGKRPAGFYLKSAYCNATDGKPGHIHEIIDREKLTLDEPPTAGRAGRRLVESIAIAKFLVNRHK